MISLRAAIPFIVGENQITSMAMSEAGDNIILDLAIARHLPRVTIGAGETLFLQGQAADAMYVVVSGTVEIGRASCRERVCSVV